MTAPDIEPSDCTSAFAKRFGRVPWVIVRAPGRVNLIGDHTDYCGGWVLPMAIDRGTFVAAAPATKPVSTFVSTAFDSMVEVDLTVRHPTPLGDLADPLRGVADRFAHAGIALPNLDILVMSSVPVGAGLSSSAALLVALATLFETVTNQCLAQLEKAHLCREVEHRFLGTPCGIMDMLVSIVGRRAHAVLIDCESEQWWPIPIPRELGILVVHTGGSRELAASGYARRLDETRTAALDLHVQRWRDVDEAMLANAPIDPLHRRRARHVVRENTRVLAAADALRRGDLFTLGQLMFESHASLRDDFEVSCDELDVLVDTAASLHGTGVYGARMTGGGFGGCAIVACEPSRLELIACALRNGFRERSDRTPQVFHVTASDGSGVITG